MNDMYKYETDFEIALDGYNTFWMDTMMRLENNSRVLFEYPSGRMVTLSNIYRRLLEDAND